MALKLGWTMSTVEFRNLGHGTQEEIEKCMRGEAQTSRAQVLLGVHRLVCVDSAIRVPRLNGLREQDTGAASSAALNAYGAVDSTPLVSN
jgi:hypothetical protein